MSNRTQSNRLTAVLVVLATLLAGCGDAPSSSSAELPPRPVKVIEIERSSDQVRASYPAVIDAADRAELSFLVGGVIAEIAVSESAEVSAGDVIARLDARDFESALSAARASFDNAEEEFQRAKRLAAQDAIASSVVEQRQTQRDVARTQFEQAEKALQDAVLRASFDGVVASLPARERQTVSPGTPVATLINVGRLEATVNLPASSVARVPTRADRRAVVVLDAAPDMEIPAEFSEADLVADATSQTYAVRFRFSPPDDVLVLPGMNATVTLRATELNGNAGGTPVSVPLAAVQSDGEGTFVWRIDESTMTVARSPIRVEPGIGETVTVISGLAPGDRIVGAGGAYLTDGMKVEAWTG